MSLQDFIQTLKDNPSDRALRILIRTNARKRALKLSLDWFDHHEKTKEALTDVIAFAKNNFGTDAAEHIHVIGNTIIKQAEEELLELG